MEDAFYNSRVLNLILKHIMEALYDESIYSLISIISMLISISTYKSFTRKMENRSHSGSMYELLVAHSIPPLHKGLCSVILAGYYGANADGQRTVATWKMLVIQAWVELQGRQGSAHVTTPCSRLAKACHEAEVSTELLQKRPDIFCNGKT